MLPTFPSRYWSTIGLPEVFSLAGWSPQIQTGFHVSRPTQVPRSYHTRCLYGSITLCAPTFQTVPGLFPFRSPLLRESTFFLFLEVLRCFSSLRSPHLMMVTGLQPAGLPHSDMCGSNPVCKSPHLFAAYHVLHRLRKPRHPPFALLSFLYI